jgi:hypothetical protein
MIRCQVVAVRFGASTLFEAHGLPMGVAQISICRIADLNWQPCKRVELEDESDTIQMKNQCDASTNSKNRPGTQDGARDRVAINLPDARAKTAQAIVRIEQFLREAPLKSHEFELYPLARPLRLTGNKRGLSYRQSCATDLNHRTKKL